MITLQEKWRELKVLPIIETAEGEFYFEPSEDGSKIIYGSMTNAGIIPEGEIEYDCHKSLDWHIQGLAEELLEKHGYIKEDE